jgi:hypothetical protein
MWNLLPVVGSIIDKLIPDPKLAAEAKLKAMDLAQSGQLASLDAELRLSLGQIEVNKVEAGTDLFRGGWRPFIGWVSGIGLGMQFIASPLLTWVGMLAGHNVAFPALDISMLMTLLFGMLGLGTLRTQEKLKGIQ